MTAAFAAAPGAQFTVFGATPTRCWACRPSPPSTKETSAFLNYDGEVGSGTNNHALRVGLRLIW